MKAIAALSALLLNVAPLMAQTTDSKVADLERKVEALAGEVERLKLGEAAEPELKAVPGFGPAASKVYHGGAKKVSVGGYGEMVYFNFQPRKQDGTGAGTRDQADALRAIIYLGYKFNDWISFNSELETEHGYTTKRGEVELEQALIDMKPFGDALGFRGGLMIVPMGLINETHEPTTFNGVKRPSVDSRIIPTTWREMGLGIFGEVGPVSYRSYLVAGLQAGTDGGASPAVAGFSATGIGGGRSQGSKSYAEDAAVVTRIDLKPIDGVLIGGSAYVGEADQSQERLPSIPVTLWEAHAKLAWRGAELRALWAESHVGNADALNAVQGSAPGTNTSVGSDQFGGYLEAAYDILAPFGNPKGHSLTPFARYERYDTQAGVPHAWRKNPANSRVEFAFGLGWKPVPQVVVKLDHQIMKNQARTGVGQTNLGLGYIF